MADTFTSAYKNAWKQLREESNNNPNSGFFEDQTDRQGRVSSVATAAGKARLKEIAEGLVAQNRTTLDTAISEAQKRQYQEQGYGKLLNAVIGHYSKHGMPSANYGGPPLAIKTFKRKPFYAQKWKTPDEMRAEQEKKLVDSLMQVQKSNNKLREQIEDYEQKGTIPHMAQYVIPLYERENTPIDEIGRKWYEASKRDLEQHRHAVEIEAHRELDDFRRNSGAIGSDRDYIKEHKPNVLSVFDKKGKPKQAILRLYKVLRGNGYIDEDGDLIAQLSEPIFSSTYGHASDLRKAAKEGILQFDTRSGVYILPKALVKKLDPYYKDYNQTVNSIFEDYAPEGAEDTAYSDLKFRNRFGYIMSLKGVKNLAKTTNKEGALKEAREFVTDHYDNFARPDNEPEWRAAPKELNSLNEMRTARGTFGEIAHIIERRRAIEGYRRERRARVALAGLDPNDPGTENVSDEEIARILEAPFEYSVPLKALINQTGGWHLARDKEELYEFGKQNHICVGDERMDYAGKIRSHKSLILIRDDVCCEIVLRLDDNGTIIQTGINQNKGPYNREVKPDKELVFIASNLVGVNVDELEDDDDPELEQGVTNAYAHGGYVEQAEENKLLKAAEGYKGTSGIKQQLVGEAETDGFDFNEAQRIVDTVLQRLKKTESGKNGGAFGTPHKATDRYKAIKEAIGGMLI
jgi:hypothetical protein